MKPSHGGSDKLRRDIESYTCGEVPSPLELLRAPVLNYWSANVRRRGKEFVLVITGDVSKHDEYPDGENIATGAVAWFDRHGRFARTTARVFALREPAGDEVPLEGIDI